MFNAFPFFFHLSSISIKSVPVTPFGQDYIYSNTLFRFQPERQPLYNGYDQRELRLQVAGLRSRQTVLSNLPWDGGEREGDQKSGGGGG